MTRWPVADALMLIDVGNTRVGMGVWDEDGVHDVVRVAGVDEDAWEPAIEATWERIRDRRAPGVVIGSVVPRRARRISDLVESIADREPAHVRDDLPFPMELQIDNPGEVGVDRICCAAAAFERVGDACAIASFGTAITIDCVSAEGVFLGGAILPGLRMSCEALHEGTAQLDAFEPISPESAFGKNTATAIGGGVTLAAVGALREIVERFATELGRWPQLVVTGGDAALIQPHADFIDNVVPDLCLMGLALTYRKAAGQA
jgi:type III pantothenate kinase